MNKLRKMLFGSSEKTLDVVMTSNTMANGRPYNEGDVATLPESHARQIISAGRGYSPSEEASADAQREVDQRLIPAAFEKRPAPEGYKALPACFTTHWDLHQGLLVLCKRHGAIESKLMEIATRFTLKPGPNAFAGLKGEELTKSLNYNISGGELSADVEKNQRPIRILEDALVRAAEAIDSWKAANNAQLAAATVACSDYTQGAHGILCKSIRELHAMGLELFGTRVSALGLSDQKVMDLYAGSADHQKFSTIQEPTLHDLTLGWYDAITGPRYVLNVGVPTMASMISGWADLGGKVATITKQAKAELTAAKKVQAVAA